MLTKIGLPPDHFTRIQARINQINAQNPKIKELSLREISEELFRDYQSSRDFRDKRHDQGIYYTPPLIAEFMVRRALYYYFFPEKEYPVLDNYTENLQGILQKRWKNLPRNNMIRELTAMWTKLLAVKICDNACGCGDFLLPAFRQLQNMMSFCLEKIMALTFEEQSHFENINEFLSVKQKGTQSGQYILEHCIYGVDLDPYAITIAKLRLLSLMNPLENPIALHLIPGNGIIGRLPNDPKNYVERINDKWMQEELPSPFHWEDHFPEIFTAEKHGFDIIVGNPPYLKSRLRNATMNFDLTGFLHEYFTDVFKKAQLKIQKSMDLSCFFLLRASQLLTPGGILGYLMTNKWFRTSYGISIRKFVTTQSLLREIHDFSNIVIFQDANVDTCIILLEKSNQKNSNVLISMPKTSENLEKLCLSSQSNLFSELNIYTKNQNDLTETIWNFDAQNLDKEIFDFIEQNYVSLKKQGILMGKGLETGCNDAFVIDSDKKYELVSKEPVVSNIIYPFILGESIKRYEIEWRNKWVIFLPWHFPGNQETQVSNFELEFKARFPELYKYLSQYRHQLEQRAPTERDRYEWYALKRYAASYFQYFFHPKIMWQELSAFGKFCWDPNGLFPSNSAYMMTGCPISLVPILNSSIVDFYFQMIAKTIGKRGRRHTTKYIEKIPVPLISEIPKKFEIWAQYLHVAPQNQDLHHINEAIVGEFYFSTVFLKEHFYSEPTQRLWNNIEHYLESIYFDDWTQLNWKTQLGIITDLEVEKLREIEQYNRSIIKKVITQIANDKNIQTLLNSIFAHPWMEHCLNIINHINRRS
jgi:hypothetical protein